MARILIVDDMVTIRRIVKTLLTEMGHEIEEADSGVMGYQTACGGRFDLIISDWNMPRGSGTDLVREHQGGTHASPKFHRRRGHRRTLASERTIWVKQHTVGRKENGSIQKVYDLAA